ncbi:SsgA family sporulation/cell division regulator [Nocardioides sp. MJB4]|uniref:SsgA family sporulation/cell division regulator n=2 Tax=Nocardioides donggukensis TaxID=2774019 RepID=A0A927K4V6_9ACTN|nr:SsgA family sporulation/cell division regulator [Nocardioides donggukensis]
MTLAAELGYCPDDPYAVTATFKSPGGDVLWTFARDLLARGLTDPVGDGDVHVWPCLDTSGRAVVIVELHSPEGELLVQGSTHEITRFVNRTLALVPAGLESDRVDVDQLIDQLLGA